MSLGTPIRPPAAVPMKDDHVWAEMAGGILFINLRGPLSPALLEQCHRQERAWLSQASIPLVLYDVLQLQAPEDAADLSPFPSPPAWPAGRIKRAVVLADARLRNPLRLGLGAINGECRLFENDFDAAYAWLTAGTRDALSAAGPL